MDARVISICAEYDVRVIANKSGTPGIGETRAKSTLQRILNNHGEDHLRMVLSTLAETGSNRAAITDTTLWAVSDLVRACQPLIEEQAGDWLAAFDSIPVGQLELMARELRHGRAVLAAMIYERLVRIFGLGAATNSRARTA
ncbi:hypothetical protein LUX29_21510 [Aureimonas altamirensis]|uniref:hypothetical protein n=1 Tax=Aureimonas altamirensis TaxID=370622 RepID=UPI001E430FC3|nr:hypothetical protein [Aureimonas altamirensis]UHD45533.1 hypothetical protein LUX29_21510 [Aureimonas altamirensis]